MLEEPYVAQLRIRLSLLQQQSIFDQSALNLSSIEAKRQKEKKKAYRHSLIEKPLKIHIKESKEAKTDI